MSEAILAARERLMSSGNLLEAALVAEGRYGDAARSEFDLLVSDLKLEIVSFAPEHVTLAREAFRRYGKGRHPAGLNFGDCMAYALAKERGEPLLFKGEDFSQTDIQAAAY